MTQSDVFVLLLWALFFLLGYLALFFTLQQDLPRRNMLPALAFGLLFVYLSVAGFTWLLYQYFGYDRMVLYIVLVCHAAGMAVYLIRLIWHDRKALVSRAALLLILDLAAVFFVTLGSRLGEPSRGGFQPIPLLYLIQAVQNGSLYLVHHAFLNAVLFIPTGFILPQLGPVQLRRIGMNFWAGLVLSTVIETVQLIAHLGLCDINDIIFNALGAAAGTILYHFFYGSQRHS